HIQLNTLYQFWIHTELVGRLWKPLEYILNTASHHRVHHGRNPYCIDKNYGGVLIIWDRLFGTFQPELDEERVAYGLVHNVKTYDAFFIQYCHLQWIGKCAIRFFKKMSPAGMIKSVLYGPGWSTGKPRLGNISDIPKVLILY